MALKEGRCPNCGSILMLDPEQEKGHCLYCDAVFDNAKAFDLAENLGDYVFPNEEQPKYEGPDLDPKQYQPRFDVEKLQQSIEANQRKQAAKRQNSEVTLELSDQAIPELSMPRRQVARVAGVAILIATIFLAIMIPVSIERDRVKAELSTAYLQDIKLDPEKDAERLLIRGNDNSQAVVLVDGSISEEEAAEYFEKFCQARAKLLDIDPESDALYGDVGMEVISTKGSWRIMATPQDPAQAYTVKSGE